MATVKRLLCFTLTVTLLLTSTVMYSGAVSKQEELQQQYDKLQQQIEMNRKKMNSIQNNKNKQKEYVRTLNEQNKAIQRQSEVLHSQIAEKNAEKKSVENQIQNLDKRIKELDSQIAEEQTEIEKTYELLKKRMRAVYIAGSTSQFEFLLSSKDIETLLTRTELMRSVAKHDNALVDDLLKKIEKLEENRKELDDKKQKLTEQKKQLEKTTAEIQLSVESLNKKEQEILDSMEDTKDIIDSLNRDSAAYKEMMNNLEREQERIDRELQEEIEALPPEVTKPGGETEKPSDNKYLQWPVPNYNHITSEFGPRDAYGYKYHYGIDISGNGINGSKIVAAESGTVVKSRVDSAYGYYILINHGNGKLTRYCHCSKLVVKEGQYVRRGQKIAEVGSTGNSSGPHLHFEVYINNKRVNPRKYLDPADFR